MTPGDTGMTATPVGGYGRAPGRLPEAGDVSELN
jgi:hypothetical protein